MFRNSRGKEAIAGESTTKFDVIVAHDGIWKLDHNFKCRHRHWLIYNNNDLIKIKIKFMGIYYFATPQLQIGIQL